ncbi:hypothetical protein Acsp02_44320 [Actinoplanes sp. NBRC 103695]|nr:hypothetical protein Acsp02_44320 [Actinoplanes sp. NBRC 103695]
MPCGGVRASVLWGAGFQGTAPEWGFRRRAFLGGGFRKASFAAINLM